MEILSFLGGNRGLRTQLEERRPALYRLAYSWCHDPYLSDDLVQEALLRAFQRSGQLKDPERLKSWLFTILANCWRDHLRALRPMDDIDEVEDCRFVWELTPEETHARLQTVGRVRAAIAQLPVGQRQVVTLVDLEECTYNEVSEILSIPIGTVMSRLCRARQALKTALAGVREEGHKAIRSVK